MQNHCRFVLISFVIAAVAVTALTPLPAAADPYNPTAGEYYRYTAQGVTFHTYTTPTPLAAAASVVIETPNTLIIQDVQQNKSHNEELLALVKSLKKPVTRIYISHNHDHHWVGLEMFEGIPVYASEATIAGIKKDGETALAVLKKKFGESQIPYKKVIIPKNVQKEGVEVIDGVKIVFETPLPKLTGPVTFMEFPDHGVLLHHHLAYVDVHVPMPSAGSRIKALQGMKAKGYAYFIGGHGTPCRANQYFNKAIAYLSKLEQVVKASATPEGAVKSMKEAYPKWGGIFLLEAIMPANFKG